MELERFSYICHTQTNIWILYTRFFPLSPYFRGWTSVSENNDREVRKYSSLVKAESKIRENKNPLIAKSLKHGN